MEAKFRRAKTWIAKVLSILCTSSNFNQFFLLCFTFFFLFFGSFFLLTETVYSTSVHDEYIIIRQSRIRHAIMLWNLLSKLFFSSSVCFSSDTRLGLVAFFFVSSPSHFGLSLLLYFWCWCKHWNMAVLRKYDRWSRRTRKNTVAMALPSPNAKKKQKNSIMSVYMKTE